MCIDILSFSSVELVKNVRPQKMSYSSRSKRGGGGKRGYDTNSLGLNSALPITKKICHVRPASRVLAPQAWVRPLEQADGSGRFRGPDVVRLVTRRHHREEAFVAGARDDVRGVRGVRRGPPGEQARHHVVVHVLVERDEGGVPAGDWGGARGGAGGGHRGGQQARGAHHPAPHAAHGGHARVREQLALRVDVGKAVLGR